MATSPTSKSAPLSGAAKDDAVGLNGDHTFTIADLLANDPGGAAKISIVTQFLFGTTQEDWDDQAGYLTAHGITDNGDGTFTIGTNGSDFQYMVQIGNKGTWSTADVDVTAPEEPDAAPPPGANLFTENFDGYDGQHYDDGNGTQLFAVVDLNAQHGWTGASHTELGADGYGTIPDTSPGNTEAYWLDTQNSPGGIDISHEFTDTTAAVGGKTAVLSFDIATQSVDYNGTHYETDPNASFEVRIDGQTVAQFDAADFATFNAMQHVEVNITGYANAGDTHTLELVDLTGQPGFTGFAVDSIQIKDWVA